MSSEAAVVVALYWQRPSKRNACLLGVGILQEEELSVLEEDVVDDYPHELAISFLGNPQTVLLVPGRAPEPVLEAAGTRGIAVQIRPGLDFGPSPALDSLPKTSENELSRGAAGAILRHRKRQADYSMPIVRTISVSSRMRLGHGAAEALSILVSPDHHPNPHLDKGPATTCLATLLDATKSPGGHRLLRQWITFPLASESKLVDRRDAVAFMAAEHGLMADIRETLGPVKDIKVPQMLREQS